jgi:hypothetical protein
LFQVWWTNNTQAVKLTDIQGLVKVIPFALLHPLRARDDTDILVAFGGVIFDDNGGVKGVTDSVKFVWSDGSINRISGLHFASPETVRVGGSLVSIRAALNTLIVSCARARHSQIDRQQRRATVCGSLGDSFVVAAALEQHHGQVHLPSGLNYVGATDQYPEGYEDMPVEPGC